jgi:uncharacterized protein (TIGR02001 family)
MENTMKKLLSASIAASVMAASLVAAPAQAEVAASVSVATSYLWRGIDLGQGTPAVSGDLSYSESGFHTGTWVSSGDTAGGTEYDLWVGYGGEVSGFTYDISAWTYVYPTGGMSDDNLGDLSEIILSVGYGAFSASYYDNVAGANGYSYLTLSGEYEKFGLTLGMADQEAATEDGDGNPIVGASGLVVASQDINYMHLDLSYAFSDNLTFTLSKIIDDDAEDSSVEMDNDLNVVISYSLPL